MHLFLTRDSSALLKSFLLQWAVSDPARMHFQMSIRTAESGMTVMWNLRVLASVIYPRSLQCWDRRDRHITTKGGGVMWALTWARRRSSLKVVEYQLQATAQLLTAAFVQVQLHNLCLCHYRWFSLEQYKYILIYHSVHACQSNTGSGYCR